MTTNTPIGILYTHTPLGINEIKHVYIERGSLRMKALMEKLEGLLEIGGTKKDIAFLAVSAVALLCSIFHVVSLPFQLDMAWVAIILCPGAGNAHGDHGRDRQCGKARVPCKRGRCTGAAGCRETDRF